MVKNKLHQKAYVLPAIMVNTASNALEVAVMNRLLDPGGQFLPRAASKIVFPLFSKNEDTWIGIQRAVIPDVSAVAN